ncbi:Golgi phosphoprotein 3-domain-containing protein [Daedaleopsis nitida]|nr:Golgi phosphoprotein 3-domain-containing protein [Daedaleopsis nitida]
MNTLNSRLARLLGTDVPVVCAPMALRAPAHTTAEVITRGGQFHFIDAGTSPLLATSIAVSSLPADHLHVVLAAVRKSIPALGGDDPLPIGVGICANADARLAIDAAHANQVRALWFASGTGDVLQWIEYARTSSAGALANDAARQPLIFVQVTSVEEAVRAVREWNADVIVAQDGVPCSVGPLHSNLEPTRAQKEHEPSSTTPTTVLLPSILAALSTLNKSGADFGGVVTYAQLAAYLSLGASEIVLDACDSEHGDGDEGDGAKSLGENLPRLTLMEEVLLLSIDKEGYVSIWNDHISYALRGCILIELALRRRIALVRDPPAKRHRLSLDQHLVQLLDDSPTGEPTGILDEDRMTLKSWIDLLSGETYNLAKIHLQLRRVPERLAQGLADKGVLRTELRNIFLFNLLTHPVADASVKESIVARILSLVGVVSNGTGAAAPLSVTTKEGTVTQYAVLRTVCLVSAAHAARVLDDVFAARLTYEERAAAAQRRDHILAEILRGEAAAGGAQSTGAGGSGWWSVTAWQTEQGRADSRKVALEVVQEVQKETMGREDDMCFALVLGVLDVLSKTLSTWRW